MLLRAVRRRYREFVRLSHDPVLLAGLLVSGVFILVCVLWPLGRVIAQGFFNSAGQLSLTQFSRYVDPASTHYYRQVFFDTLCMGLLSAGCGTALGFLCASGVRQRTINMVHSREKSRGV